MARHLSVATAIEKNRIASTVAFVVALKVDVRDPLTRQIAETYRIVNNAEDLTIQGELYTASAFTMNLTEKAGEMPTFSIDIEDITRAVESKLQPYKGGVGSDVHVYVVNSDQLDETPEYNETFKITGASSQGYKVSWKLGIDNPLSLRFPRRRMFPDQCSFKYKGPECGYTGSLSSCDLSRNGDNGCTAHYNVARFGGFPALVNRS